MDWLAPLLPHLLTGVAAGLVAWGGVGWQLRWLRRDVDGLRFNVHSPENPKNLTSVAQNHESRLAILEDGHGVIPPLG